MNTELLSSTTPYYYQYQVPKFRSPNRPQGRTAFIHDSRACQPSRLERLVRHTNDTTGPILWRCNGTEPPSQARQYLLSFVTHYSTDCIADVNESIPILVISHVTLK